MSNHNQDQAAYLPPSTAYPAETHGYVAPPPPAGYPTKDGSEVQAGNPSPTTTTTTKSRGDGFWKGCCAALCCCCALDACF